MSVPPDSALANLEQIIADLRRELAQLTAQQHKLLAEQDEANRRLDDAQARETATAELLQVINSSPGDLKLVFEAILEKALSLCEANFGIMFTYDGERVLRVAQRGLTPAFNEWRDANPLSSFGIPPSLQRLIAGDRVVYRVDMRTLEAYPSDPNIRALVDLAGARTSISVPLRRGHTVCGMFVIFRQEVRPFTEKQIALLENFATQAVIAMENARLLTEQREALERQTATAEVLQVINSSPGNLTPVFESILERAHALCGVAYGILQLYDGTTFRAVAVHGRVPEAVASRLRKGYVPPSDSARSLSARSLIEGADFVHIPDMAERAVDNPTARAVVDSGIRTMLWVPLRKDGKLLGRISAGRQEVRPFSDKEIALLQNFAAQAVIAMENARLINETREALEQRTATAEVLQVINSSPGDLTPVFDAILQKAHSLCGVEYGNLQLYDGRYFRAVALRGLPPPLAELVRQPHEPTPEIPLGRLVAGERFCQIPDIFELVKSGSATPRIRAAADAGIRTLLLVPLRREKLLLGAITAGRKEARPFSEKEITLLENFAAQAVIAMENARLLTETREALEQQTATAEVLQVINSSPGNLAPVFEIILEKAHALCGADCGSLQLYDGEKFYAVAVHGRPEPLERRLKEGFVPGPKHPARRLLVGEDYIHIHDFAEVDDPMFRVTVEEEWGRTLLSVALRRDNKLFGRVNAIRKEVRPFADKEISLLRNFAAQAVIAMENARLLGELRERTDQVAELNRGLEARVAEQVEELGRVGRLKRFLAPQLAELIVSQGDEKILESHRREIVVVFCDLRGYTAFAETAEPEEVLNFLREYHGALGPLVSQFEGTLDQFSGDGIMVFFNDPVPIPDPAERAVKMAVAMREAASTLIAAWRERGRQLGFGVGIAQGYATLGQIGFSERSGYTAIGTVCNVAARLCGEAKDGQILLGQLVNVALKGSVATEQVGALVLKGLTQPVVAYNVPFTASQPALRVIDGGNH
jgi:adenylate cyclase